MTSSPSLSEESLSSSQTSDPHLSAATSGSTTCRTSLSDDNLCLQQTTSVVQNDHGSIVRNVSAMKKQQVPATDDLRKLQSIDDNLPRSEGKTGEEEKEYLIKIDCGTKKDPFPGAFLMESCGDTELKLFEKSNEDEQLMKCINDDGDNGYQETIVYRSYSNRWWLLITVVVVNIANLSHWIAFPSVNKVAATFYDQSGDRMDMIPTVSYGIGVPMCILATYVVDKSGLKASLLIGGIFTGLGGMLCFMSSLPILTPLLSKESQFYLALIGQALTGIACPFISCTPTKISQNWFSDDQRTIATIVIGMSSPLGIVIGQAITPLLVRDDVRLISVMNTVWFIPAAIGFFLVIFKVTSSYPLTPPSPSAHYSQDNDKLHNETSTICHQQQSETSRKIKSIEREEIHSEIAETKQLSGELYKKKLSFRCDEKAEKKCQKQKRAQWIKNLLLLASNKAFVIMFLFVGAAMGYISCISTKIEQMMCARGYSDQISGLSGSLILLCGFIASFVYGILAYKTGKTILICKISGILSCVAMVSLAYFMQYPDKTAEIIISCCLLGVFSLGLYPQALELIVECTYPVDQATSTALIFLSSSVQGVIFMEVENYLGKPLSEEDMKIQTCAPPGDFRHQQPKDYQDYLIFITSYMIFFITLFIVLFDTTMKRSQIDDHHRRMSSISNNNNAQTVTSYNDDTDVEDGGHIRNV